MEIYICFVMFILGTILGSFYNVVGYRLPLGQSIVYPPSHCPNCNSKLTPVELIPIFSYIFQKGKCKHCKNKISSFYTIFEVLTGALFSLTYLIYGLTPEIIVPLTFISMLIIVIISDYKYMIIPDEVLLTFGLIIIVEIFFISGFSVLLNSIINAFLAFLVMFALKLLGDFIFKKESMGGGDIKLLGIFGLVLGLPLSIVSIFLASLIGLPISLFMLKNNPEHIIPFGPFLSSAAIIIILLNIDFNTLISLIN